MNKEEKQLKSTRDQLLAELKECDDKLDAIKAQKDKEAEIKRTYQPNYIERTYEMRWKEYAIDLEHLLTDIVSKEDETFKKYIDDCINKARNKNSYEIPVDRSKIWNCPKCGESNVLYVGDFGEDAWHPSYAVTCSQCDFIGPKISDYGEAWCEFEDWLKKKGYLKDEN